MSMRMQATVVSTLPSLWTSSSALRDTRAPMAWRVPLTRTARASTAAFQAARRASIALSSASSLWVRGVPMRATASQVRTPISAARHRTETAMCRRMRACDSRRQLIAALH